MGNRLLYRMNEAYLKVSTLEGSSSLEAVSLMKDAISRYREGDRDSVKKILEEVERIIWECKLGDICE